MRCPRCDEENPPRAKFCLECGAPLARTCANCGAAAGVREVLSRVRASAARPASPEPRFAAPEAYTPKHLAEKILSSRSALEGERKQVTMLFADLKGSMATGGDPRRRADATLVLGPARGGIMSDRMSSIGEWRHDK
jgi:Double zinc ribbon